MVVGEALVNFNILKEAVGKDGTQMFKNDKCICINVEEWYQTHGIIWTVKFDEWFVFYDSRNNRKKKKYIW